MLAAVSVPLALAAIAVSSASADPASEAAAEVAASERAIVRVATVELPAGRSAAARGRWHRLRARAGEALDRVAARNGLEIAGRVPEIGALVVALEGESVAELRGRLAPDPLVLGVEPDGVAEPRYAPNDPVFHRVDINAPFDDFAQWHLRRSGAVGAWDLSRGTDGEVAVVDTGADVGHPDLAGRVVGRLDCSHLSAPLCSGTDVSDGAGHGTHVSGLACADSDNGYGLASAGFDCNLYVARVQLCSAVVAAIVAAANRFSDAINLSLGGCNASPGATSFAEAVSYAWARGSVPVAAGTNTPTPGADNYPAQAVQPEGSGPVLGSGHGLVVTGAKYSGQRSAVAQRTSGVSVAGYGFASDLGSGGQQGILSTWPDASTSFDNGNPLTIPPTPPCGCRTTIAGDDRFAYLNGTSMAAPQVAGTVALMRAVKPNLPAPKLVRIVKLTASNCGEYANGIGWGVVNPMQAVAAALDRDINAPHSNVGRVNRRRVIVKRFEKGCSKELPSSGVKAVTVFVSANGGAYRKLGKTRGRSLRFGAKPGHRYRFYSVAVDKAGNREAPPPAPDAKLRIKRR